MTNAQLKRFADELNDKYISEKAKANLGKNAQLVYFPIDNMSLEDKTTIVSNFNYAIVDIAGKSFVDISKLKTGPYIEIKADLTLDFSVDYDSDKAAEKNVTNIKAVGVYLLENKRIIKHHLSELLECSEADIQLDRFDFPYVKYRVKDNEVKTLYVTANHKPIPSTHKYPVLF